MAKNNLIPAAQHYKLFESNDIAKFGIMLITGKALPPIAYKALMYLIWKWTCVSGTDGNSKNAFQPAAQSYDITLPITELGWALGYCRDKNRNFARDMRNICNAVQNIMATPLTVYDSKENKALTFVWLCLVEYDFNNDLMHVQFTPGISKYFGNSLSKAFTVIKLKYLNRLTTSAAVILYPFFCRYSRMRRYNYSVADLAELLTGNPDYRYRDLKSKFIKPAIEQINDRTDIKISFKENKQGKKVTSLVFWVEEEPALDEKEAFAECNAYEFDYASAVPYNDQWMQEYDYDMGTQSYVERNISKKVEKYMPLN